MNDTWKAAESRFSEALRSVSQTSWLVTLLAVVVALVAGAG